MKLYRPVGFYEYKLIEQSSFKVFPPRLYWQPIFYPVKTLLYARRIAKEWNTTDKASGFIGYVTSFEINDEYIINYEEHIVGNNECIEYWIPSNDLPEFNKNLKTKIDVIEKYIGEKFVDDQKMEEVWKNEELAQNEIYITANKVQELVSRKYKTLHENSDERECFNQAGILNGLKVISEYLEHNESGLAIDHILYQVNECKILLNDDLKNRITMIIGKYGIGKGK